MRTYHDDFLEFITDATIAKNRTPKTPLRGTFQRLYNKRKQGWRIVPERDLGMSSHPLFDDQVFVKDDADFILQHLAKTFGEAA